MFTDEPVDSSRSTMYSRPREYSTYKGFTFVANSVKKDLDNENMDEVKEESL